MRLFFLLYQLRVLSHVLSFRCDDAFFTVHLPDTLKSTSSVMTVTGYWCVVDIATTALPTLVLLVLSVIAFTYLLLIHGVCCGMII